MFDKLELHHVVRYLFSGTMLVFGLLIANDVSWLDSAKWLSTNAWAREAGPTTAFLLVVFLAGFISFTIYRGFIYEYLILWLKGILGRLFGVYSYRDYLCDLLVEQGQRRPTKVQAESIYALLKVTRLKSFYQITASPITTGLHFLYFCTIILFLSAACHPIQHLYVLLGVMLGFLLVVVMDWHFEALELLVFMDESEIVKAALSELIDKGLWGASRIQEGAGPTAS